MTEREKELRTKMQEGTILKDAENGDVRAQRDVGDCYYYGCGVDRNRSEAMKWYHLAAEQGDADTMHLLSSFYLWGSPGLERNTQTAIKWMRLAAEKGHKESQIDLGDCYANGHGVEKDCQEALKWYDMAGLDEADKRIIKIKSQEKND